MNILCPTDKTDGRHTVSTAIHHLLGSLDQSGVIGQSQVIVGTEVQYLFTFYCNGSLLRTLNQAFLDFSQCLAEEFLHFTVHGVYVIKLYCKGHNFSWNINVFLIKI